jgi:hypothetical protein
VKRMRWNRRCTYVLAILVITLAGGLIPALAYMLVVHLAKQESSA